MNTPNIEDAMRPEPENVTNWYIVIFVMCVTVAVQLLAATISSLIIINSLANNAADHFALVFVPLLIFCIKICYSFQGNTLDISKKSEIAAEKIRGWLWLIIFICTISGVGLAWFALWVLGSMVFRN